MVFVFKNKANIAKVAIVEVASQLQYKLSYKNVKGQNPQVRNPRKGFFKTEDKKQWLKVNTLLNNDQQRFKVQFGATLGLRKFTKGNERILKVITR